MAQFHPVVKLNNNNNNIYAKPGKPRIFFSVTAETPPPKKKDIVFRIDHFKTPSYWHFTKFMPSVNL